VAVVVLDEPDLVRAGGFVAAPAFRRIMEMSLRYLGVMSKEPVASSAARTPLLAKSASAPAERRPAAPPESGTPIAAKPALGPIVDGARLASSGADNVRVPDLRGASPRQAVKALFGLGLTPSMQGTGRLLRQDPEAGAMLAPGSTVTLVFEPSS
jgi:hypothetical protein